MCPLSDVFPETGSSAEASRASTELQQWDFWHRDRVRENLWGEASRTGPVPSSTWVGLSWKTPDFKMLGYLGCVRTRLVVFRVSWTLRREVLLTISTQLSGRRGSLKTMEVRMEILR